jgi:pimeloyl-ACP methyl ester carboxylesterase
MEVSVSRGLKLGQIVLFTILIGLPAHLQASAQETDWTNGTFPSSDGVSISYQLAGVGPLSLVFVHGWSCDRTYWREQLDHFAAHHRVVAVDLAGHGESGLGRKEWTMAAFGEDVAAVVNGLGLEKAVLVGHSMGGSVIVEASRKAPGRVVGLVVVDDFVSLARPMSPERIESFIGPFEEDFRSHTKGFVEAAMFVPESDQGMVAWISEDMASAPPAVGIDAIRNLLVWYGDSADPALREVRVPIQLINSDYRTTDLEAAGSYGITAVFQSGVGHFVMMEDPETFNLLLSEAMAGLSR